MANGDAATAAGYDVLDGTEDRRDGYSEINKSRDYVAGLRSSVLRSRTLTRDKRVVAGGGADITASIATAASGTASGITSPVQWASNTYFRFSCCGLGSPTSFGGGVSYKGPKARGGTGGDIHGDDAQDVWVNDADGTIELNLRTEMSGYQFLRLYADGVLILDVVGTAYIADQQYMVTMVLGANRSKTVHLRWVSSMGSRWIKTGQHGIAWTPTHRIYKAVTVAIGDSFMVSANDPAYSKNQGGFLRRLGEQFGLDARRSGYSGTGLTTNAGGTSGKTTYVDRVAESKTYAATDMDFGILQLSTNDSAASSGTITTAMTAFVTAWRTQYVRANGTIPPIFVIGVARSLPTGPNSTVCNTIDNAVAGVMALNPDLFPLALVPTTGWWTGDGYITHAATTTPKGTTETGISGDGLHPSDYGHDYIADRVAPYLATFLGLINLGP